MAMDTPNLLPDFIRFLFSNKPKFDCVFQVGNVSHGKPERIGAVKIMLMAHSEVFRLELEDSELKDKENVAIPDIHPDTFKGMLKYVYGHDTTADMCFDEADNLLYVAEKYMMKTFKNKLAARLIILLNPDNICSLLNNPACYTHLQLDAAITEILRYETDHVLESPQFLWMNRDGFLKILQQDGLAVEEIDLWRAAVKWAKHRANSEDGQLMRQQLSGLTQHLRVCALTSDEVCMEVVAADILTKTELIAVCQSVGRKRKPEGELEICDEIAPRKKLHKKYVGELSLTNFNSVGTSDCLFYDLTILTKKDSIELLPLVCRSEERDSMDPECWTYEVDCSITITEVMNPYNPDNSALNEPQIIVSFSENVKCGVEFEIPIAVEGKNVTLLPDTKYSVEVVFNGYHQRFYSEDTGTYRNDHLTVTIGGLGNNRYYFPSTKLRYIVSSAS